MKMQAKKTTIEELQKQLQEARREAKAVKSELKKVRRERDDLELKVNLLECLKGSENLEKSKLSTQW